MPNPPLYGQCVPNEDLLKRASYAKFDSIEDMDPISHNRIVLFQEANSCNFGMLFTEV